MLSCPFCKLKQIYPTVVPEVRSRNDRSVASTHRYLITSTVILLLAGSVYAFLIENLKHNESARCQRSYQPVYFTKCSTLSRSASSCCILLIDPQSYSCRLDGSELWGVLRAQNQPPLTFTMHLFFSGSFLGTVAFAH